MNKLHHIPHHYIRKSKGIMLEPKQKHFLLDM